MPSIGMRHYNIASDAGLQRLGQMVSLRAQDQNFNR
jgi:hypothetical protein